MPPNNDLINAVSILKDLYTDVSPDERAIYDAIDAFWNIMASMEEYPRKDEPMEARMGYFGGLVYNSNPLLAICQDTFAGAHVPVPIKTKK